MPRAGAATAGAVLAAGNEDNDEGAATDVNFLLALPCLSGIRVRAV